MKLSDSGRNQGRPSAASTSNVSAASPICGQEVPREASKIAFKRALALVTIDRGLWKMTPLLAETGYGFRIGVHRDVVLMVQPMSEAASVIYDHGALSAPRSSAGVAKNWNWRSSPRGLNSIRGLSTCAVGCADRKSGVWGKGGDFGGRR